MPKRNVFQICSGLLDCKMMPSFVSLFYQEKRKRQNLKTSRLENKFDIHGEQKHDNHDTKLILRYQINDLFCDLRLNEGKGVNISILFEPPPQGSRPANHKKQGKRSSPV